MDRGVVHRVIYEELCLGRIEPDSKREYIRILQDLKSKGAEGVILGCTEISPLIYEQDSPLPLFDTTHIHAKAAVDFALGH